MGLLLLLLCRAYTPRSRMADITAKVATKRPFNEHRLLGRGCRFFVWNCARVGTFGDSRKKQPRSLRLAGLS
jgi:hypothetical protein